MDTDEYLDRLFDIHGSGYYFIVRDKKLIEVIKWDDVNKRFELTGSPNKYSKDIIPSFMRQNDLLVHVSRLHIYVDFNK